MLVCTSMYWFILVHTSTYCYILTGECVYLYIPVYPVTYKYIGGQIRAHFFKSVHKSAKCAFGRKIAHFFDVL